MMAELDVDDQAIFDAQERIAREKHFNATVRIWETCSSKG
jgi:hypothetical protein